MNFQATIMHLKIPGLNLGYSVPDLRLLLRSELLQRRRAHKRQQRHLRRQDHSNEDDREESLSGERKGADDDA